MLDRAVALDMDGVIVDGMQYHVRAWQTVIKQHLDREVSSEYIYQSEGNKGSDFVAKFSVDYDLGLTPIQQQKLYQRKVQYFDEIFRITAIPYAQEMVAGLRQMGYTLALVTGTERASASEVLRNLGILQHFKEIISGDDVVHSKPNPEPYLTAAKRLNVLPERCLVIENAPNGIAAARAAGMTCLAVETSLTASHLHEASWIFPGDKELLQAVVKEYQISTGRGDWLFTVPQFAQAMA